MPLVQAKEVGYTPGGLTVLDGVSVDVLPGEVLAVTGPSGSGKSSLLALLAGLAEPDSGAVLSSVDAGSVGLVLQAYGLVNLLTAAENVEVALQARGVAPDVVQSTAAEALAAVRLTEVADHLIEELSGGQQQRVAIARALAIAPSLLIADEVTAELDADTRDVVVSLMLAQAARGAGVVLATHDLELAARCDRRLALVDGRVAEAPSTAPPAGTAADPDHPPGRHRAQG
jgi:ABC-type lipoprotein export system ATPase subunit